MADPTRADEFVMTAQAAALLHWHVGQVVPLGVFTSQQADLHDFGTARVQPTFRVTAKLVGIVMFASQVVRDEADKYPTFMLFTPAFTDRVLSNASYFPTYALTLGHGSRDVTAVEQEVIVHFPKGYATELPCHVGRRGPGRTRDETGVDRARNLRLDRAARRIAHRRARRSAASSSRSATTSRSCARSAPARR